MVPHWRGEISYSFFWAKLCHVKGSLLAMGPGNRSLRDDITGKKEGLPFLPLLHEPPAIYDEKLGLNSELHCV